MTSAEQAVYTPDDEWARIAREEIHGYAGHYVDTATGAVIVALADTTETATKLAAFRQHFQLKDGRGQPRMVVRTKKVDFDFDSLKQLHDVLFKSKGMPRTVSKIDIDEVRNRLVVSVWPASAIGSMRQWLTKIGIPERASIVDAQKLAAPASDCNPIDNTNQNCQRPLVSGLRITNAAGLGCTLGVNVLYQAPWGGIPSYEGFVTASHCSTASGQQSYDPFNQGGVPIGTKQVDMPYDTTCHTAPGGCRYSDAAVVQYQSFTTYARGWLPEMEYINDANPLNGEQIYSLEGYQLTGAQRTNTDLYYGNVMEKIGEYTGWTTGSIVNTCFESFYTVDGLQRNFRCQYQVTPSCCQPFMLELGDSGSPVFNRSNGIVIEGIATARASYPDHDDMIFSPWYSVMQETVGASLRSEYGNLVVTPP